MTLQIVGQHKGCIELSLNSSTVLDLKNAVSRASGLPVAGLKLLAGGKHLKDDAAILAQCGVKPGQKIVVLRQDLSSQVDAEGSLSRRTDQVVQAASLLSARAARDIDAGRSGSAWEGWGRDHGRGRGGGRGRPTPRRRDDGPRIELTNQDGEAMTIPPEDSAALMEGIMLHGKGLACLRTLKGRPQESSTRKAKRVRSGAEPSTTGSTGAASGRVQSNVRNSVDSSNDFRKKDEGCEERKATTPAETQTEGRRGKASDPTGGRSPALAPPSVDSAAACSPSNAMNPGKAENTPRSPVVGEHETVQRSGEEPPPPSALEKRLVQREALGLLLKAEEAFRRSDPAYLEQVDNFAYLCLDIVWLLFLMKDMSNLELASRMLEAVEAGFKKAHGPGLQRLTALKGEFCAEKLLYVRLHLLQGVVAFLKGDSGTASTLLIRASEEAKAFRPNPILATRLVNQWRSLKFEPLQRKVALQALRAGRNDLDAAWQYLEGLQHRKGLVREQGRKRAKEQHARRFGRTANKKEFVDAALVDQLVAGGFMRQKVIRLLRKHNNDVESAMTSLASQQDSAKLEGVSDESIAVLESLGIPQDTARDILGRTGNLCDALSELGISAPDGVDVGLSAREGGVNPRTSGGSMSPSTNAGESSELEEEDDKDVDEGVGEEVLDPSAEELRLYGELMQDREREGEEGYLDVTLEDEADAADMYLHLCRGNIPLKFDLARVRAGIAEAAAAREK